MQWTCVPTSMPGTAHLHFSFIVNYFNSDGCVEMGSPRHTYWTIGALLSIDKKSFYWNNVLPEAGHSPAQTVKCATFSRLVQSLRYRYAK